ncbi:hypothetical protein HOT99_gp209 [Caulobacter phage CcrBL10]|uniref:Uncharacterized protein n=1 Tax=Caulobacter phage CcrBL10 TaxID=2283269 RepID=A0A385ECE3_9CAUD|nr:hypothetical protein HOT99_gp209 [Caulobacter phage CcrBL10]AXQ68408.1 hypothetical protein CcrBL10_gp204c [Caulobacter phage CcrBL10]
MQTFSDHLREAAQVYYRRDVLQRTAWDVMSAKAWGDTCMKFAERLEGKTIAEGCAALIAIRDGTDQNLDLSKGYSAFVGWDVYREITKLVDPFVKDGRGWIEQDLSKNDLAFDGPRPTQQGSAPESYCRYIGTNQMLSSIRKGKDNGRGVFGWDHDEDPQAWAARKAAWFSRYAPDLPVISRDAWNRPGDVYAFYPIIGRAGDFAKGDLP